MTNAGLDTRRWGSPAWGGLRFASYLKWLSVFTLVLALSRYFRGDWTGGGAMVISTAALYGWSNALRALTELIDVQGERLLDD